jgi:hypothetical protein
MTHFHDTSISWNIENAQVVKQQLFYEQLKKGAAQFWTAPSSFVHCYLLNAHCIKPT